MLEAARLQQTTTRNPLTSDEAQVRQKNYVLACRFFVHVNLLNILLEVVGMSQNPSMVASARVAMLVAVT